MHFCKISLILFSIFAFLCSSPSIESLSAATKLVNGPVVNNEPEEDNKNGFLRDILWQSNALLSAASMSTNSRHHYSASKKATRAPSSLPEFYVITTIFNPASYKSRYALYHDFANYIRASKAQLVTIECIFPSFGQSQFQVTSPSNPLDIQITSPSVYWVKENLINIAVSKLPPNAKYVAWLDADVYIHENNWIELTIAALQNHSVVQMFKYAHFLNEHGEIKRTDSSFGYSVVNSCLRRGDSYPHPGYGWAMQKSTFEEIGGLPTYSIIGSGDLYFAYTLVNRVADVIPKEFDADYQQEIKDRARKVYKTLHDLSEAENKSIVGFVEVTLSHRWHGDRQYRGYADRLKILIAHRFNAFEDMTTETNGLLHYRNGTESLQQDVQCYFENRNEDGKNHRPIQCHSMEYMTFMAANLPHARHARQLGNFYMMFPNMMPNFYFPMQQALNQFALQMQRQMMAMMG